LIEDQGEIATVLVFDSHSDSAFISSYATISSATSLSICNSITQYYLSTSNLLNKLYPKATFCTTTTTTQVQNGSRNPTVSTFQGAITKKGVVARKKYKPVALKVRPVIAELPERYRIHRHIKGDPLQGIPTLNLTPPQFSPTGRYTLERRDEVDKNHGDFLWDEERALMHDFMCQQNRAFAWNNTEKGRFRPDFFPPIDIPVIPHIPFIKHNIPIPPGIYDEVCAIIKKKIDSGVYEPSNSSYRSRWFCVLKKDGTSLRIVHSLEPLNHITIKHTGVPPIPEHLAEQFAGCSCGAMLDLYVGYDE